MTKLTVVTLNDSTLGEPFPRRPPPAEGDSPGSSPLTPEEAEQAAGPSVVIHRAQFLGSGREYFQIWIVNLALTILTLGI